MSPNRRLIFAKDAQPDQIYIGDQFSSLPAELRIVEVRHTETQTLLFLDEPGRGPVVHTRQDLILVREPFR